MSEPDAANAEDVRELLGRYAPDKPRAEPGSDVSQDARDPDVVVVYAAPATRGGFASRAGWGTLRIGVGVDRDRLRAVALRGRTIMWAAELAYGESTALDTALATLLRAIPRAFGVGRVARRRPVAVAVGSPYTQVKHLVGVPPVADHRELTRMLAANAGRFFRKNGVPLVVTGTHVDAPGRAWAAVVEAPALAALDGACRRAALRLTYVVPTLAVLAVATPAREVAWVDGGALVRLTYGASGQLHDARRTIAPTPERLAAAPGPPMLERALEQLNDRGWEYADAYGAAAGDHTLLGLQWSRARRQTTLRLLGAVAPPTDTLRDQSRAQPAARRRWIMARLAAAALACTGGTFAAVAAPTLAAWRVGRQARAELRSLAGARPPHRVDAPDHASRRATVRALEALSDFDGRRRSVARVLAAIAASLPDRATLISFACDSAGGTVVVVAPRAARVVEGLEGIPGLADAAVVGAITREAPPAPTRAFAPGVMPYAVPASPTAEPPTAAFPATPPWAGGAAVPNRNLYPVPNGAPASAPSSAGVGVRVGAARSADTRAEVSDEPRERATIRFRFDRGTDTAAVAPALRHRGAAGSGP